MTRYRSSTGSVVTLDTMIYGIYSQLKCILPNFGYPVQSNRCDYETYVFTSTDAYEYTFSSPSSRCEATLRSSMRHDLLRGRLAGNLVGLYLSLGGGWQLREGNEFISDETRNTMQQRTNWGDLLENSEQ